MILNPFYYGGTLKDPRRFTGRQEQVAEIFQAIHDTASVSVVGERQIGKSSLLRYVADPTVERKNGLLPGRHVFVYFDFQGFSDITPAQFWCLLLGQALPALGDEELDRYRLPQQFNQEMIERLARRAILLPESLDGRPQVFSPLFSQWVTRQIAFIASDQVDDLAALVKKAEVKGFRERWIDRTERLRSGFAWVDSRAIFKALLVEKGPEAALNLLSQIIIHYITT
jgi:hypothetical protein